jgi:CBS domain-containing protein
MSAGRICSRVVATASPDETIGVAARRMAEYDVGTIVMVEGGRANQAVGILTDRDIAIRCIGEQRDPESTPVSAIMTRPVQSVGEHTPIEQAVARMASAGTRRLVVTGEADRVVGILGLDDVIDLLAQEAAAVGRLLEKQQPRIPA